jgi:hypothetical protein
MKISRQIIRQIISLFISIVFLITITGTVVGAASDPEVNMEPIGHFGGTTDAVDAAGNYAYGTGTLETD